MFAFSTGAVHHLICWKRDVASRFLGERQLSLSVQWPDATIFKVRVFSHRRPGLAGFVLIVCTSDGA